MAAPYPGPYLTERPRKLLRLLLRLRTVSQHAGGQLVKLKRAFGHDNLFLCMTRRALLGKTPYRNARRGSQPINRWALDALLARRVLVRESAG